MISCNLWMAVVSFAFHVSSSNTLIWLFDKQFFIRELLSMFTFDSNAPTSPSYFPKKKKKKFRNRNSNNVVLLMKQSHSWALAVLVILILSIFLSFIPSVISFICLWSSETLSISSHCDVYVAARAYLLGYNCADEKELEAALRFCWTKYCSYSSGCFYWQQVSKFYFLNVQGCLIQTIMFYVI